MTDDLKALRESPLAPFAEEIDRLRAELAQGDKECARGMDEAYRLGYERGAATARATAFEEAAQTANIYASGHPGYVADKIRTLASLPPSLVAVPVDWMEEVGLTFCANLCPPTGGEHQPQCVRVSEMLKAVKHG